MPRIFGYGRSSTDRQEMSCEIQRDAVELAVKQRMEGAWSGYEYMGFTADQGVSGKIPLFHRPGGQRLLRSVERGDVIVVSHNDRAFRSLADLCDTLDTFEAAGIDLCILDIDVDSTTNTGRVMLQIMASIKEFERREISRRTKDAKRLRLKQGRKASGNVPLGYKPKTKDKDSLLEADPEVRAIGAYVAQLKDEKGMGYRNISNVFREFGVCWPKSHPNRNKLITSQCALNKMYKLHHLGWPLATWDDANAMWAERNASREPAQLRRQQTSCLS